MNNCILIVEDDQIAASSLAELLKEEGYFIIGPVKAAADAIAACEKNSYWPDIALCDIRLANNEKGTELAQLLVQRYACEIIFLTAYADQSTLQEAFKANPVMYVVKPYNNLQLLAAVHMAFHKIFTQKKIRSNEILQLTAREREIIQLIAKGLTTRQIAQKTGLSTETVKTHRKNALRRNSVSSIPQLVFLMNQ